MSTPQLLSDFARLLNAHGPTLRASSEAIEGKDGFREDQAPDAVDESASKIVRKRKKGRSHFSP